MAERGPALLRKVGHHRVEQAHQDFGGLADRPSEVGRWLSLQAGDRGVEGVHELIDVSDADVKAQPLDVLRNAGKRLVGGLAQRQGRFTERRW